MQIFTNATPKLGYSIREAAFYLEDGAGRRNVVPYLLTQDERVCIGISQEPSQRALFVASMDAQQSGVDQKPYTAVGAFSTLSLY